MPAVSLLVAAALLVPSGDISPPERARRCVTQPHELGSGRAQRAQGELALLVDAADGELDELTLLEAALLAGGQSHTTDYASLAAAFAARCEKFPAVDGESQHDAAQRIFEALHTEVFTGRYQARSSDCSVALKHGDYNCVTATVLYIEALRQHGIKAEPYAMVGHVFCRVGEEQFDVETTCARWFRLSQNEAHDAARRAAPGRAQARATARSLSDVQLVGKIYYNRGVASFRRNEFQHGIQLTQRSLAFDPHDEVAHGNLLAGLNNWGLHLCQQNEFSAAERKFDELQSLAPDYPTLAENVAHLYRLWGEQRLQHARGNDVRHTEPQG